MICLLVFYRLCRITTALHTLPLEELIEVASGLGKYKPKKKKASRSKKAQQPEEEYDSQPLLSIEHNPSVSQFNTYRRLLSADYIPDVSKVSTDGSVTADDMNMLPGYISSTPIFNAVAARIIGVRFLHGGDNVKSESSGEGGIKRVDSLSKEDVSQLNVNIDKATVWLSRAAHAGDAQVC